jgi:hypothetical protein
MGGLPVLLRAGNRLMLPSYSGAFVGSASISGIFFFSVSMAFFLI